MSTPIGDIIVENHDKEDEKNVQVVLVIDAREDKREYCYDYYDPAGNFLERVGYTVGVIEHPDGHIQSGDTVTTKTVAQKSKLNSYLTTIGIEVE